MKKLFIALAAFLLLTSPTYALDDETTDNALLTTTFNAVCDGTTDDSAAFASAITWLKTAQNRVVYLPAGKVCATSTTIDYGDGHQQNTSLSANALTSATSVTVSSITGINNGDTIVILLDNGNQYSDTVNGTPSGTTVNLTGSMPSQASSGAIVFTGRASSYNGGGFVGYGPGATGGEMTNAPAMSTIKYIGSASATTTLSATASAHALSLTVGSTSNMTLGTPLGITLDDGSIWWTSINYISSSTVVTLMNELPSQATSGNSVKIGNNPVFRINGPMVNVQLSGIRLNANALAFSGLDAVHPIRGNFNSVGGLMAFNYTGVGFHIHSARKYFGTAIGLAENDFLLYAESPNNTHTIGMWLLGTAGAAFQDVAFSRNRFYGGIFTMGGADATAAAIREEFLDNNTFIKTYVQPNGTTINGASLYRMPSHYRDGFSGGNMWIGAAFMNTGAAGSLAVTDGPDTTNHVGDDTYDWFDLNDGAAWPTDHAWGSDQYGNFYMNGIRAGITRTQKTANYTVTTADNGTSFDNKNSSGTTIFTLPAAASGLRYCFAELEAYTLEVLAASGDKIAIGLTNSASTGNIQSGGLYSSVCLEAHSTVQWIASSVTGKWTIN